MKRKQDTRRKASIVAANRNSEPPAVSRSVGPSGVSPTRDLAAAAEVSAAKGLTNESPEPLVQSVLALYVDFRAADPIDSILARVMCGLSSMTMENLLRARLSQFIPERELELKSATRGALVLAELVKA